MGDLFEWLRRADAFVLGAFTAAGTSDEDQPVWSALAAVVGGLLVLTGGVLLGQHARAELVLVAVGLLLTVPHLQSRIDRARAAAGD